MPASKWPEQLFAKAEWRSRGETVGSSFDTATCLFSFLFLALPWVMSEKAMAPHSSTLAWKIPWMEEPGRLQSMGLLRVRHDWATSFSLWTFMHWRRKWQPTPVFLPGESQGRWAWWAAVYGVTQSRTQLKWLSSSSMSHVRPQFPNQGSNLCPLHWESGVNHWTTREVPDTATFLSEPFSISLAWTGLLLKASPEGIVSWFCFQRESQVAYW